MNANARRTLPTLEPFYYLKNFELVLSAILARYADLLAADEMRFITEFPRAPHSSRALLARMVMRRGHLFRASKLNYREIGDTRVAAAALIEAGWLADQPMLCLEQLQGVLTKAELIRSLALPRRYADWRKPDLVAMLDVQWAEPREFVDWCRGTADYVYALLVAPMCERFRLMFFGNDRQSWSEFVTADLMIFNYEKVERSLHSRAFQSRAQIDAFQRLQRCSELLQEGAPLDDVARTLCLLAKAMPESEAELPYVRRVLPLANRKLGMGCDTDYAPPAIPEFELMLDGVPGAAALEYHVRDHLARDPTAGSTVRYVENGLINSLFGLLCWPAIFAAIPGAFFHDFHHGPADLVSGHFYGRCNGSSI